MPFTPAPPDATNIVAGFSAGLPPTGDVADRLIAAPHGRAAWFELKQESEDAGNMLRPLLEEDDEARQERYVLDARKKHLLTPKTAGGAGLDESDVSFTDVVSKIARIDERRQRLAVLIEDRRAGSRNAAALASNTEAWMQSGVPAGTVIRDYGEINLRDAVRKGEGLVAAIDRHRLGLHEIAAEQHRIKCAQQTLAEAMAQAQAEIDTIAVRGEVDASALLEAGLPLSWPMTTQRLQLVGIVGKSGDQLVGNAMGEVVDVHALTVWLFRETLTQKITEQLTSMADPANALSAADREQQLSDLAQQATAIARREVALIRRARAEGHLVAYRVDTEPQALLGVTLQVVATRSSTETWGMAAKAVTHVVDIVR